MMPEVLVLPLRFYTFSSSPWNTDTQRKQWGNKATEYKGQQWVFVAAVYHKSTGCLIHNSKHCSDIIFPSLGGEKTQNPGEVG